MICLVFPFTFNLLIPIHKLLEKGDNKGLVGPPRMADDVLAAKAVAVRRRSQTVSHALVDLAGGGAGGIEGDASVVQEEEGDGG